MSAECHECGADLNYDLSCTVCDLRARLAELEASLAWAVKWIDLCREIPVLAEAGDLTAWKRARALLGDATTATSDPEA
jgi:hypothetical protein